MSTLASTAASVIATRLREPGAYGPPGAWSPRVLAAAVEQRRGYGTVAWLAAAVVGGLATSLLLRRLA